MSKNKHTNKNSDATETDTAGNGSVAVAERPNLMTDPFRRLDNWFDQWPSMFARRFPEVLAHPLAALETMRIEEFVDDDDVVFRVEAPGFDIDNDVDIAVENNQLTVSAKRERREETGDGGFRSEFHYGSFRRTMSLPVGTDADDIEATYNDGILEIRVPKNAASEARHIPIQKR